ncbi:MAG: sulfite exporter TauE/SafE family protein, partial [Alphaproteobacteria bacterium]|nr:sulfite exporter TauE/SafE family protein [Alphaproteobacteria bacterium]
MPDIPFPADYFDTRLIFAVLSVFAAGLIRGFSGFGSALINAPILSLIWGPTVGVPVAALVEIAPAIQLTPKAIKIAHWKTVWAFSIPAVILLPLGTFILVSVPADDMRRAIGAIVLVVALILWSGWRYRGPRGTGPAIGVGLVGGA